MPWQQDKNLQKKQIHAYLRDHSIRKLQFGCGPNELLGWLNTDIVKCFDDVVYLDITGSFPLPSNSIDFMTSEHLIEHINFDQAIFFLSECIRTLKPNGVIRITTPDLAKLLSIYTKPTDEGQLYIKYITEKFITNCKFNPEVFVINNAFRNWGHQFLYDSETFYNLLKQIGFKEIKQLLPGASDFEELQDLDVRNKLDFKEINNFEVMVFEATKA